MSSPKKFARVSATLGALFWCLTLPLRTGDSFETDLIQKIFLLSAFVIVPLGLSLITIRPEELSLRVALWMQPIAAVCVLVSFVLEQGLLAAVFSATWLVTISFVALGGLLRAVFTTPRTANEVVIAAGLVYLPIGGAWLVASRFGLQPLGFGDTIVLLTAVHFHYAGFAASILAGLAGRFVLAEGDKLKRIGQLVSLAGFLIIAGTPLVAAGITVSPTVALVGTLTVASGLAVLGVLTVLFIVPRMKLKLARVFLTIASISSVAAMVLASLYAYSIVTQTVILNIPQMAKTHGLLNSFGFSLCGLLAWFWNETASD